MTDEIDILLAQPLASVADDGFSERVMGRVRAATRLRLFAASAAIAVGLVLAFLLVPVQDIGVELYLAVFQVANSAAVGLAAAAIILTLLVERQFSNL
jgi:hypothetical protein